MGYIRFCELVLGSVPLALRLKPSVYFTFPFTAEVGYF